MQRCTSYEVVAGHVPERVRSAMMKVDRAGVEKLSEVRLRSGRAVSYVFPEKIKFLTVRGQLTDNPESAECLVVRACDISECVSMLSHYSLHSCERQLKEGCFVLKNGVRAGVSGTYSAGTHILRDFTGVNFRISREVRGCADKIFTSAGLASIIIAGEVNSGKTTVLRDICRVFGRYFKISLIDTTGEISFQEGGEVTSDIGVMTDVICGTDRADGIKTALKTLSPDIIVCDEISSEEDVFAIIGGIGSGARFIASVHAGSFQDLLKRDVSRKLISACAFDCAVILKGREYPAEIAEIRNIKND